MSEVTKVCSSCCAEKPRFEFNCRAASQDGLQPACRECERAAKRARYERDRDAILAKMREANAANPERNRLKAAEWARLNPERVRERVAKWRASNPGRTRRYSSTFAERHPDRVRANTARQRARRRGAMAIPFTAEQLVQRLSMWPGCWMCGGPKESVDHVKPLSRGGAHILANLRPACGRCNSTKGDRWPYRLAA